MGRVCHYKHVGTSMKLALLAEDSLGAAVNPENSQGECPALQAVDLSELSSGLTLPSLHPCTPT